MIRVLLGFLIGALAIGTVAGASPETRQVANRLDLAQLRQELARERTAHAHTRATVNHYRRGWLKRGRTIKAIQRGLRSGARSSPIGNHWLEQAFLCIKSHEGAWGSATGNGYYGGLQMDRSFYTTYGSEYLRLGTPASWPSSVQIAVGIEAYLSGRGFGPWPNTRKMCGL